jgi:hypothetical protein
LTLQIYEIFQYATFLRLFFQKTQKKDRTTLNLPPGGQDCEAYCIWKRVMFGGAFMQPSQHHCLAAMTN